MKFKEITVERNFRISNDDPYLKERITATVQLDDTDNEQMAMNMARQQLVKNFKLAYPNVYTYLNFDEVIQKTYSELGLDTPTLSNKWQEITHDSTKIIPTHISNPITGINLDSEKPPTLEEQIQSCETIEQLRGWQLIANMQPKLKELYENKYKQLQLIEMKDTIKPQTLLK